MFITRKSIVAALPAQPEQKVGVGGDRCLRLRFRLDQRIAHAVLERVARAASRGRVFDVGMRLHHRAAGAQGPIGFSQIVLQLASGRGVSSELENATSKGLKQRRLAGLLYLENALTSSAFTPDRTAVLELLAAQAAISLENTRLYSDLQEREAKVRRLVDANIIGIFIWDFDGHIHEANDAFLQMVGYDREGASTPKENRSRA
jgi:PAS domain-containing protein